VDAVIGQHRMDLVGHGLDEGAEEVGGYARGSLELDEGKLGGPVDRDEEAKLTLLCADLSDVDVEVADWVRL
jgi:hypothetical protein